MTNLDELEALARAVQEDGWYTSVDAPRSDDRYLSPDDEAYIKALSPDTVLSLIAEVRRLRADKERLDYLDEANARLNAKYGTSYKWRVSRTKHNVNHSNDMEANRLPSCRDAIDKARAALGDTNV